MREILWKFAVDAGDALEGIDVPCKGGGCGDGSNLLQSILNWAYLGIGIAGVVVLIIGGVQYVTSEGDPGKTKVAQQTITYAIIGILVAIAAAAITSFVVENVK
jgi:hypothetical protein